MIKVIEDLKENLNITFKIVLFFLIFLVIMPSKTHANSPSIMGVKLGEATPDYPTCPESVVEMVKIGPCYSSRFRVPDRRVLFVGKNPEFIVSPLTLHIATDGTVDGINMTTGGIGSQGAAYMALTDKFGPPTKRVDGKAQNLYGAAFDTINASWIKPDYEVDFIGATIDLKQGDISISTAAFHASVQREEQAQKAPF